MSSLVAKLAHAIARRPGLTLGLAGLLTLVLAPGLLRVHLETDLVALLPEGSPAAAGYRLFIERFGGLEKVYVLVELGTDGSRLSPEEREAVLLDGAALLAARLEQSPEIARVRAGLAPEDEAFFMRYVVPRAPLLLDDEARARLGAKLAPAEIHRRVTQLRAQLSLPGAELTAALAPSDPLGLAESLPALRRRGGGLPIDPLSGLFLSPEGDASLLVLDPAGSEIDPAAGRRLVAVLETAAAEVRAELGAPIEIRAVGGPLYAAHDEELLRADLERSITSSVLSCALLLGSAFEGLLLPLAAFVAVGVGLLWTASWVGWGFGALSAVGVGFAAVLVGLGVDYAVHGCARLREALLAGQSRVEALVATFRATGAGIASSALTTIAAFAVLGLAHFRPLRELGIVVAVGMFAILLATATVGAALAVSFRPRRRPGLFWRGLGRLSDVIADQGARHPRRVVLLAGLASVLAIWGVARLELDADPRALRPADHPAFETEQRLVELFGLGLDTTTIVVGGRDLAEALAHAAAASRLLRRQLGEEVDLTTPANWLVSEALAADRLAELRELPFAAAADQLETELRAVNLDPRAFAVGLEALRALGRGEDPAPAPEAGWPGWLSELVRRDQDGAWAALRLRLPSGMWPAGPPAELERELQTLVPGAAIASAPALGSELRQLAVTDLERLGAGALVLVVAVVVLSLRGRVVPSVLALVPVCLGTLWSLGLWGALGRPLDLVSLTVLPILLGIGIDDGLHAVHGMRLAPEQGLLHAVKASGRAMVLCSLTTCFGFGSLVTTRVPGLKNSGLLVAVGVLLCLAATLWVLPALGALGHKTAEVSG